MFGPGVATTPVASEEVSVTVPNACVWPQVNNITRELAGVGRGDGTTSDVHPATIAVRAMRIDRKRPAARTRRSGLFALHDLAGNGFAQRRGQVRDVLHERRRHGRRSDLLLLRDVHDPEATQRRELVADVRLEHLGA